MEQDERIERFKKFEEITYFLIIGLISLVSSVFIPLIDSTMTMSMLLPNTKAGWFVFIISKLSVALINILIFFCFTQQAKVNIKEHPKYLKALEILDKLEPSKTYKPQSPQRYITRVWLTKGTSIMISSILSTIAFGSAILNFKLPVFLANIFTVGMGLVFGYLQMRRDEEYWTTEFLKYAIYKENNEKGDE